MNWKKSPDHPMRRDSDQLHLVVKVLTYKPLWYVLGFLFIALGFDFKTPAAHFKEIEVRAQGIDIQMSIMKIRQDSVERVQSELQRYIKALAIAQCIDRPARETRLMGLPCVQLTRDGNP